MPNLLYIDTAAAKATVACTANGRLLAIRTHDNAHEQAAVLQDMISSVLQEASVSMDSLHTICVCAGPGSYTGLRVGLSTAKGIAYVKNIPLMLFNRLDLLAWSQQRDAPFAIALKARAGEYFFAGFDANGEQTIAPMHAFAADLQPYADQDMLFLTDDTDFAVSDRSLQIDATEAVAITHWIAKAEARFAEGRFDDLAYSEPFYLKGAYTTQSKK